jgi:hypothetical protein
MRITEGGHKRYFPISRFVLFCTVSSDPYAFPSNKWCSSDRELVEGQGAAHGRPECRQNFCEIHPLAERKSQREIEFQMAVNGAIPMKLLDQILPRAKDSVACQQTLQAYQA